MSEKQHAAILNVVINHTVLHIPAYAHELVANFRNVIMLTTI